MVVDDSPIFRNAIVAALNKEERVTVVGSVSDGKKALEFITTSGDLPDLITLDVEMPNMDGLETLNAIQEINRSRGTDIGVLMISSLTDRGSEATVKALAAGAFDFIVKPSGENADQNMEALRSSLLVKVRYYTIIKVRASRPKAAAPAPSAPVPSVIPAQQGRVEAVVIGVSTGGPQTLSNFLPVLCDAVDLPILIVQHMPPLFTETLARNLGLKCPRVVCEAAEGDKVEAKKIYIAPGGRHMTIRKNGTGSVYVALNDQPTENGCKPSVNHLFRSASEAYSGNIVAIVLTGMGSDGSQSMSMLKQAGAYLIAQDEPTSVVWGMPKSAVETGFVDEVLPVMSIPEAVKKAVERRAANGFESKRI